jgi:hypothetical protein
MNTQKNPYIISEISITVVYDHKPYVVDATDRYRYDKVKDAILRDDWDTVYKSLDIVSAIEDFSDGDISVVDGEVFYKGTERLHGVVVDKLLELLQAGLKDSAPLIKFITNLLKNPSKSSVDELYDFLSYKSLPIDADGYVIAYKGVRPDGYSCSGNTRTTVLQGKVDSSGHILNEVGATIEVERRCVDDNRNRGCSHGLHVGSWAYASTFGSKTLMVRFNPADAVSVPRDCQCQKLRVCKYEVLAEIGGESTDSYLDWKKDDKGSGKHREVSNKGWNNPRDSKGRFAKRSVPIY